MKNGLIYENGELIYYVNGSPKHAGVVKEGDDIYYISSKGRAVRGKYVVHRDMANGIIKRGVYTFGDDYKLVKGSRVAPKRRNWKKIHLSKKTKQKICIVSVVFLVALFSFVIYQNSRYENISNRVDLYQGSQAGLDENTGIILPEFSEPVLLCSQSAKKLYDHEMNIAEATITGNPYCPFVFQYMLPDTSGILCISEKQDMTHPRTFTLDKNLSYIEIDNLKTGTHYYYTVTVGKDTYKGDFDTAESTRFVKIPGTINTRDIGGYYNLDGKKVKQGLLIRGVEIDGLVEKGYYIPREHINEVQETFGFVYDFDLRSPVLYSGAYKSPLGENVGHAFYNSVMYGGVFNADAAPILRRIFSDLADPNKYPMYLHCTYGTDRTGTIIYLLQGLLNMSEEDMEREYKLTGFVNRSIVESYAIEAIASRMKTFNGNTLQQQIENFLINDVGVTQQQINTIKSIFLE